MRANGNVRCRPTATRDQGTNVFERAIGAAVMQGHRPHVAQRHIAKKGVATQIEVLERDGVNAHHCQFA